MGGAGGRMGGRPNTWRRRDEVPRAEDQDYERREDHGSGQQSHDHEKGVMKNGKAKVLVRQKKEQWGSSDATDPGIDQHKQGTNTQIPDTYPADDNNQMNACENCGLNNHITKDCRKIRCEICGLFNHSTYDCKECLAWNVGLELCAAQVEGQGFFYIEQCIDSRVAHEKASTDVISVLHGVVNAKQIAQEFMDLISADAWRWRARPVADNKFLLRFPTARMVTEWSRLRNLTLKNDAHIKIEAWSPAVGAKGMLQSCWFRVSGIPADQRSIRTIAKVGGLVGKVIEIDEGTIQI